MDDRLMGERVQCYISDDEEELAEQTNQLLQEKSMERERQNQQRPQTGVKGVLEDYHQYQNYEPKKEQPDRESLDSDLSLSDDDDEAFQRYREARLKEMERRHSKATAPVKSDLVEELNLDTYVKVAENAGHVAICIYKPSCANSTMVLRHLEHLAKSLPHVKFARANGELVLEASSALLKCGLPCFTGNFNGRQTQALVWLDIKNELGEEFDAELLVSLMKERRFF